MSLLQLVQKVKSRDSSDFEIIANIFGSFLVRGASMVLSLFTMPAYIRFFQDKAVLGVWYTLLSVMTWVTYFDLGLGNGLRNKLPACFVRNDTDEAKKYIASTYMTVALVSTIVILAGNVVIGIINWNGLINISENVIARDALAQAIRIVFVGIVLQFVTKLIANVLYAIQRSAVVNFLTLCTTAVTLLLVCTSQSGSVEENIVRMAWINAVATNVPYIIATILVFAKKLSIYIPHASDFSVEKSKEVLGIGTMLLWLQVVFMVISSTNEVLISHLASPADVVTFQAYNKIFNTVSSLFTLALVPIWSAVTKAQAQKKYQWILKLNKRLLIVGLAVFGVEMAIVPFLQKIVDVWLGTQYLNVEISVAVIFVFSNTIFYIHNVNTSFGNGASFFKIQIVWMTVAAIIDIPLAYCLVRTSGSWIGVILANIIALLPYEVIEIVQFNKYMNKMVENNEQQ